LSHLGLKSAFYVMQAQAAYFEECEAAAKWLCVPVELLLPKASGTAP